MLYELVLSLRQCVYALLGAERSLPWFALLPPIVLALMIVPLVGCGDKSGDKPAPARPVRYVVIGSPATLPSLERTGEIHAHDETALSFRTAGRMLTRAVDIGDRVNYGQLLATLDDTSAQNQLDSATADEESARATARVAALNVSRMQKLIATGAIARSQLDSARADWLVASARVKSSEAALRNARESLVPGMLTGLVLSIQIFTLFHMSVISAGIVTWVLLILSFVVTLGLESYIWPQIALLDLPLYGILKNSLLLFLGYLPRSLGAIAIKAVYWGAILLFFPLTTIILPFTNFWLPMLPALLCIYQPLNKCFTIESTINKMREDELNAALAKDNEPLPEDPTEKAEESTEASSDDSSSDVQ